MAYLTGSIACAAGRTHEMPFLRQVQATSVLAVAEWTPIIGQEIRPADDVDVRS